MLNKTTSFSFESFGTSLNDLPIYDVEHYKQETFKTNSRFIESFLSVNEPVYIEVLRGIATLVVTNSKSLIEPKQFVIHRIAKLNAHVFFNVVAMTDDVQIRFTYLRESQVKTFELPSSHKISYVPIRSSFQIQEIYAYFYQVRSAGYSFRGEQHPYYELTYVDNGILYVTVNGAEYKLEAGDIIVNGPNDFHTQHTDESSSCSYATVLFEMKTFDGNPFQSHPYKGRKLLYDTIRNFIQSTDSKNAYASSFMISNLTQLMGLLLTYSELPQSLSMSSPAQQNFENELLNEILIYINTNIYEAMTIEDLCLRFSISRSSLQVLFKNNVGTAPKHYISDLKLNKSKILIKQGKYTISEISNMLGFNSIHYFSRKFKQRYDIAPSDYARTIYD